MSKTGRIVVFLACIAIAIVINLVVCRWGTNVTGTTVLSIVSHSDRTDTVGLFAAPWLEGKPFWATLLGVLLPMGFLALGVYLFIRNPEEEA
ncbi:MAG: hypothetical protein P8K80_01525 [Phycisphaerales bacterium]|nr:hypothetical protein [Phycisphaerales bacterium]